MYKLFNELTIREYCTYAQGFNHLKGCNCMCTLVTDLCSNSSFLLHADCTLAKQGLIDIDNN